MPATADSMGDKLGAVVMMAEYKLNDQYSTSGFYLSLAAKSHHYSNGA
jgi:hypothetical protein